MGTTLPDVKVVAEIEKRWPKHRRSRRAMIVDGDRQFTVQELYAVRRVQRAWREFARRLAERGRRAGDGHRRNRAGAAARDTDDTRDDNNGSGRGGRDTLWRSGSRGRSDDAVWSSQQGQGRRGEPRSRGVRQDGGSGSGSGSGGGVDRRRSSGQRRGQAGGGARGSDGGSVWTSMTTFFGFGGSSEDRGRPYSGEESYGSGSSYHHDYGYSDYS
jgi:hypothetical protein